MRSKVYDVAVETPLEYSAKLSKELHTHVYLKREDLQPVFSFKLRGAYNKMVSLTPKEKAQGVIAASAGNHAQGVALAAQKLGIKAVIVMPKTTPSIKINAVRALHGKVVLHGNDYNEAYTHAVELAASEHLVFIHPYDDPKVIAGQGTVGMEILKQAPSPIDAIFVPVGGGGLIAGVAAYVKAINPSIKIIGVESDESACLWNALKKGHRVRLKQVGIFADGVAVKQVGKEPFRIAKTCVDQVITCSTDEICAAIKDIFDSTRSIAEPAGALALAGLKKYVQTTGAAHQTLVSIVSGANINFDRLRHISERAEIGEQKEAIFAVTIPEKPGSFKHFCKVLGKRSITEFNYRFNDPKNAHIFVGVELSKGKEEKEEIAALLREHHYPTEDLTDNEMAKLHIRHMVGGTGKNVPNERLFRFHFPERPGALLEFLNQVGEHWNISLFHYRNHGAAFGRVLVGMQVPASEFGLLKKKLKEIGYAYEDEAGNPAYRLFLK